MAFQRMNWDVPPKMRHHHDGRLSEFGTPAILQLHKWGPSQSQLNNLSEFRQAFISPTRELLLLLSHQCEALLLPLVTGDSIDDKILETGHNDYLQHQASAASSSQQSARPGCSDSKENDASVADCDNGFSIEDQLSTSNSYPYICDVNSLSWGVCGDTYNLHDDVTFRELLFVSNGSGVTVHAFREPNKTALPETILDGEFGQGRWVQWGPSSKSAKKKMTSHYSFGLYSEGAGTVEGVNNPNENGEIVQDVCRETGVDQLPRCGASKKWLRSFLTEAETIKSDSYVWTRFPEKTSFPWSAKVVSFNILDKDLLVLDFQTHS